MTLTRKEEYELERSSSYRWVVLFASFFAFVVFVFAFQSVPPILGLIQSDFGVGDVEAGLLISMVVIPGIVLALPAGFLIDRYGFRLVGVLSILSVAVGSLTAGLANTFGVALFGRFILGLGGAFLTVGTPTIVPQWFAREEMGKSMGILATDFPVAVIIAFPTATVLTQNFGWRVPFCVAAMAAFVCALVFAVTVKEGPLKRRSKNVQWKEVKEAVRTIELWKLSLLWMFFSTANMAFSTWAPTIFQGFKSLEPFQASILASLGMYCSLFFAPLFGRISDRFDKRKPLIIAGSVFNALSLVWISYAHGPALWLSAMSLGISGTLVPPVIMSILGQSVSSRLSGIVFSITALGQSIGVALSAPLGGYLLQTTQSVVLTFLGISLFAFACAAMALTIESR